MKFMGTKKALFASLLVTVMAFGIIGEASARERGGRNRSNRPDRSDRAVCFVEPGVRGGFRNNISEAPQEIQEKWAAAQRLGIDMRLELGRETIDRDKVLELRQQRRVIMQEISDWRFMQRLDALTNR